MFKLSMGSKSSFRTLLTKHYYGSILLSEIQIGLVRRLIQMESGKGTVSRPPLPLTVITICTLRNISVETWL
jgi:hypothetical protein